MVVNRTMSASFVIKTLPTRLLDRTRYLEAYELRHEDDKRRVAVFIRFSKRMLVKKAAKCVQQAHDDAQELRTGQTVGQWRTSIKERILPAGLQVYLGTYADKKQHGLGTPLRTTAPAAPAAEATMSVADSSKIALLEAMAATEKLAAVLAMLQGRSAATAGGR